MDRHKFLREEWMDGQGKKGWTMYKKGWMDDRMNKSTDGGVDDWADG